MVVLSNPHGGVIARLRTMKDTGSRQQSRRCRRPSAPHRRGGELRHTHLCAEPRLGAGWPASGAWVALGALQPSPAAGSLHYAGVYSMIVRALPVHDRGLRGQPVRFAPSYRPRGVGRPALLPKLP